MKRIQIIFLVLFFSVSANGQKYFSGPQVLSFHSLVDGTDQPYGLYLPKNFNEKKSYPFVVMLHGAGSNHRLALRRVFGKSNLPNENDVDASLYFPDWEDVPYIVATPLARGTMGYQGVAETDVWDMIADVKRRFKIDDNRTYLTGLSMGGGGTLWLGLTRPDFWAAIAPVCPAPPPGTEDYIDNAFSLPTHFFHGDEDPVVPKKSVDRWVEGIKNSGTKVEYTVFPGIKHNSWEKAYENEFIFKWFEHFKREKYPKELHFSTSDIKYNTHYWIQVLAISPGKIAKVKAKIGERLEITTENVEALKLLPNPHLKKNKALDVTINGQKLSLGTHWAEKDIVIDIENLSVKEVLTYKKNGTQNGPMTAATSTRHIYVYGTLDNPSKEEAERRRKIAEEAADWSFYRGEFLGRVMVFPRVLSDKELSAADFDNSNLILFGTEKSNAVISKYSEILPFKISDEDTKSLTYIYPNERRVVLINSGIPFWKIPLANKDQQLSILRSPGKTSYLYGYGDWLYYDGKESHFGYFDNNWKVRSIDQQLLAKWGILK